MGSTSVRRYCIQYRIERAPALIDNLLLMFVAPFFFVFEVINLVFGYRAKEVREWDKVVALEIKQFREKKVNKRAD